MLFDQIQVTLIVIFFICGLVHGIVGFSFALLATPLVSMVISVQEAILITLVPTIWANIVTIITTKLSFNILKNYIKLFIFIIIGTVIGTHLLFIISTYVFNIFLILLMWLYLYIDYKKATISFEKLNNPNCLYLVGLLLGISTGISNIMSPILLIYFLSTKKNSNEIIVVSNISFLISKITQLCIFSQHELLSLNYLYVTIIILITITISLFIGQKIRQLRLIISNYVKIVKISIFLISLILLFKTFF